MLRSMHSKCDCCASSQALCMQLQLANALLHSSDTVQRLQIAFVYMCMYVPTRATHWLHDLFFSFFFFFWVGELFITHTWTWLIELLLVIKLLRLQYWPNVFGLIGWYASCYCIIISCCTMQFTQLSLCPELQIHGCVCAMPVVMPTMLLLLLL